MAQLVAREIKGMGESDPVDRVFEIVNAVCAVDICRRIKKMGPATFKGPLSIFFISGESSMIELN